MISDIDIWRAAKLMIDQYGQDAAMEAAQRSNRALDKEDEGIYETWAMAFLDSAKKGDLWRARALTEMDKNLCFWRTTQMRSIFVFRKFGA